MEKGENGTTITAATAASSQPLVLARKRSGGSPSIFRAMMLAFRGRSSKKAPVDTVIKTLVNGMRPLHYSLGYHCPAPPPPPPNMVLDAYYDVGMPPPSSCSSACMSRYASAEDLQLLDTKEDNEEEGSNGEPNAIDMKAEEFIAMFYKQMRLQRMDSLKATCQEKTTVEKSEDLLKTTEEEKAMVEESDDLLKTTEEEKAMVEESDDLLKTTEEEKAMVEESASSLKTTEEEKENVEESVDSCKTTEEEKAIVEEGATEAEISQE